jgi:hypothetical protein
MTNAINVFIDIVFIIKLFYCHYSDKIPLLWKFIDNRTLITLKIPVWLTTL